MTGLRAAIVGGGAAGWYAADELLRRAPHAHVDLFERLPTPGGFVRFGVAPDHADRRRVTGVYESAVVGTGRFRFFGNVAVGRDVSHAELLAHYHAVIYATGAPHARTLHVPGEELPGSYTAEQFVGWYNGQPEYADLEVELSAQRAVVIGNGNVALDIARMLLLRSDVLDRTDVADHALPALADSAVTEVVIVGRRGPREAACSWTELQALCRLDQVAVTVEGADAASLSPVRGASYGQRVKARMFEELAGSAHPQPSSRRIRFMFGQTPDSVLGDVAVTGIRLRDTGAVSECTELAAELVIAAVGFVGAAVPGLPFDAAAGVIRNDGGRVVGDGVERTYVTGWAKRGARGVIGSNKICARATVDALLDDHDSCVAHAVGPATALDLLLAKRTTVVDFAGWRRIDRFEVQAGSLVGRPRRKVVSTAAMVTAANT